MINEDTISLLRECNSGTQMAVYSINEILETAKDQKFRDILTSSKHQHEKLGNELHILLQKYGDSTKDPGVIAKGMSWMKTNMKLSMEDSDATIAELMTDGCNMGVKSLNRYLNQYKAADEVSKDIAKRLINLEERLAIDIRQFL